MPLRRRIPAAAGVVYREKRPRRVRPRSFILHIVIVLVLAVLAVAAASGLVWLLLGTPNLDLTVAQPAPSGSPSATPNGTLTVADRLDAVKIVLAIVGGVGAIVVLTAAYRKQRNEDVAAYWEETKTFADRFAKAVELLGNTEHVVRIGAISALAQLADEWAGGRQMCIDTLCGYLRMPYESDPAAAAYSVATREVRRMIIREIRNHLRDDWTGQSWRGHRFSFERAVFDCGDLSKAVFEGGNVTFHRAQFAGNWFEFDGVQFRNTSVHFGKAKFAGARVTFRDAVFVGSRVSFQEAEFDAGNVEFDGARFVKGTVTFEGATHASANLTFNGATRGPQCSILWDALAPSVPSALL